MENRGPQVLVWLYGCCEKLPLHCCWNHCVSWHCVDLSCYLETTAMRKRQETVKIQQTASSPSLMVTECSMSCFYKVQTCICADGGVPLHRPSFNTGSRRASCESLSVFLSLPLPDDGLTSLPLLHSLLIHGARLLISLKQKPRCQDRLWPSPWHVRAPHHHRNTSSLHFSVMVNW